MKLHELIVKLQAVEKTNRGAEVSFRHANIHAQRGHALFVLDIEAQGGCLIVLGDYEGEEAEYIRWQEGLGK
jgi:hypothetical protein